MVLRRIAVDGHGAIRGAALQGPQRVVEQMGRLNHEAAEERRRLKSEAALVAPKFGHGARLEMAMPRPVQAPAPDAATITSLSG